MHVSIATDTLLYSYAGSPDWQCGHDGGDDEEEAFSSVDHTLRLKQISASAAKSNVVRWLAFSISLVSLHSGVPQGSVLSPSLYNFFISDFPLQAPLSHSFADDIYAGRSSPDLSILAAKLNEDMRQVKAWADSMNLTIAPEKSSITLFTPDPHQASHHPQVFYKSQVIPLDRNPKWLGLIQDGRITSSHHASNFKVRLSRHHQIVKALSGTSWVNPNRPYC
jgi:hypothetical protein